MFAALLCNIYFVSSILWASNFLLIFLILSLDTLILTLVFWLGGLIPNTDPSLALLLLLNYGVSIILFTFLLSVIMKKSSSGAVASLILFFQTFLPVLIPVSLNEEVHLALRIICNLFMSTSFGVLCV